MSKQLEVFDYLFDGLVEWKPKSSGINTAGSGFNDSNVVNIERGALPTTAEYDYVFMSPPIESNGMALTTGGTGSQSSIDTYTLDVYTKRVGAGNAMKRATLAAMYENSNFIKRLFTKIGFTVAIMQTDLNYDSANIARQTITITKVFL